MRYDPDQSRAIEPVVAKLFASRGNMTALAGEMRCPVQTVHSWKRKGSVPSWRRSAVLDAVRRLNLEVSPDLLVYLNTAE